MIKKVWAYIVREHASEIELLVFEHVHVDAAIQIPGGTVEPNEDWQDAVQREVWEEAGVRLEAFTLLGIFERLWEGEPLQAHLLAAWAPSHFQNEWVHQGTGNGEDANMQFRFYWLPRAEWQKVCGDFDVAFSMLDQFSGNP